MTERKISATQLSLLLFLCTLAANFAIGSSLTEAITFPLGMGFIWLALIPVMLGHKPILSRLPGRFGKWLIIIIASLLLMVCIVIIAQTLSTLTNFMTMTVYPESPAGIFILCTAAVCAYGATMGLEGLGRMALWVTVYTFITLISLTVGLLGFMQLTNLINPFEDLDFITQSGQTAISCTEILLFVILLPRTRGKPIRAATGWLLSSAITIAIISIILPISLGSFAKQSFPLHAASTVAQFSPNGRMDLLYLFFFVFLSFIRGALWIYAGCLCMRRLFPHLHRGACALLCAGLSSVISFLNYDIANTLYGWILLFVIIAPLLLRLIGIKKKEYSK